MFRTLLCPSSGARDYTGDYSMWHIALCLKLVVWSGVGLQAMRPGGGMLLLCPSSGARDYTAPATSLNPDAQPTAPHQTTRPVLNKVLCATCCNRLYSLELLMMGIVVPETCWADYKFNKPLCSI